MIKTTLFFHPNLKPKNWTLASLSWSGISSGSAAQFTSTRKVLSYMGHQFTLRATNVIS